MAVCSPHTVLLSSSRFFVFGGFGPAGNLREMNDAGVNFVRDDVYSSGWIDQLVYYDIGGSSQVCLGYIVRLCLM